MVEVAARVESWVDCKLPKKPNGEDPRPVQPVERSRSRSKSRPRQREQTPTQQSFVEDAWAYGEEVNRQSTQIMTLLKSARRELKETGTVSEDLQTF